MDFHSILTHRPFAAQNILAVCPKLLTAVPNFPSTINLSKISYPKVKCQATLKQSN